MNFILVMFLVCVPGFSGAAGAAGAAGGDAEAKVESKQASEAKKPAIVDYDKVPTCDTCVAGFMGADCKAREVAAIEKFQQGWLGWDEKTRAVEVIEIGLLSQHHAHPGSARVVDVLLPLVKQSKLPLVRTAAIIALGIRQDPSIAVPILLKTFTNAEARIRVLEPRIKKLGKKTDKDFNKIMKAAMDPKARKLSSKERARMKEDQERYFAMQLERIGVLGTRIACLASMGSYKDDRCTKLLLKGSVGWEPNTGLAKALLRNGAAPCVARVIKGLKYWEKRLAEHDKIIKKITKQRAPSAPKNWRDDRAAWKRYFENEQREKVKGPRKKRDACISEMQTLHNALERLSTKQNLSPAKFSLRDFASNWQRWLKTNRGSLPKKHPLIPAPTKGAGVNQ